MTTERRENVVIFRAMTSMNTPLPVRVLELGYSYVRRLRDYLLATDQVDFNLAMTGHSVNVYGLCGMKCAVLDETVDSLQRVQATELTKAQVLCA